MTEGSPGTEVPSGTVHDVASGTTDGSPPATPRWVKVFGIVGALLVLLLLAVLVFGGSEHGPGRHGAPSGSDGTASPHEGGNHTPAATHHTTAPGPGRGSVTGSGDDREPYDGKPETQ